MSTTARTEVNVESEPHHTRNVLIVLISLMMAMLLSSLDQTIFSTALPTIVGDLHGVELMSWVLTVYILASTVMLPVYGKLGDLIGRKGIFIAAISIFIFGSIVGGLSQDMTWLIVGRGVQGIGGGGLMILSQAILADVVSARERGKYMGLMMGVFALSSVAGPLLGGWFTDDLSWRWCLWLNVPTGILAILAAVAFLHLPKRPKQRLKIDVWGMVLLALTSTGIVLISTWGGSKYDWDSVQVISLIIASALTAVLFVMVELRTAEPVMPMTLFKRLNFNVMTAAGLAIGVAMFGVLGYVPTYLQMVTGANATQSGLLMIPMMGSVLVASVVTGALITKSGRYKWAPLAGTLVTAAGLVLLSSMRPSLPVWVMCTYLAVMGLGLGLTMQVFILVVQNTFSNAQVGVATATNNYFRQIGASIGAAVVGSVFTSRLVNLMTQRMPHTGGAGSGGGVDSLTPQHVHALPSAIRDIIVGAYNDALTPIFLWLVPLVLAATVVVLFLKEVPLKRTIDRAHATAESMQIDGSDAMALSTAAISVVSLSEADGAPGPAVTTGTTPVIGQRRRLRAARETGVRRS